MFFMSCYFELWGFSFLLMGPRIAPDVTTKSGLINNIDISIILMFVVCKLVNKTKTPEKAPESCVL